MYSHFIPLQGDLIKPGESLLPYLNLLGANTYYEGVLFSSADVVQALSKIQIYFGMNFAQDEAYLYLKKSDLTGLTPSINNKAESLLAAIFKRIFELIDEALNISFSVWTTEIGNGFITRRLLINIYFPVSKIEQEIEEIKDTISPNDL
ncbi:hypothetical protein BCD64_23285 [Nostoc sp. MBR 210]|nr:hypothetical protein BCD64_23285 [Nostoc sp. MBR 210]